MKKIILVLTVLMSFSIFANEPIKLDGQYKFNRVEAAIIRDTELVPSFDTKRFNELVAAKYNCYLRGDFFSCQKFIHNEGMPDTLKNDMNMLWSGRFIEFKASLNTPSLTNESEYLLEWDIFDNVKFEGFLVSEYHYYLLKNEPEIHKIALNFASGQRWFVIQNEKSISTPVERIIRISNLKTKIYNLDVYFTR